MFRMNNGQFRTTPPATVVMDGYRHHFTDLTRQQWDELGYNEAVPLRREPFTTYETKWVKGDDLIYREEIVSEIADEEAKAEFKSTEIRAKRDQLLIASDWTQLVDCALSSDVKNNWTTYRQSLRDLPQQAGFPFKIEWPEAPTA